MKTLMILMLTGLLAGCAGNNLSNAQWQSEVSKQVRQWQLQPVKRITTFNLDSWASLGENYLIIRTTPFKPYLIELASRCSGLSFANALLTEQSMSSSLSAKFDSVATPDNPDIPCRISKIYPLTQAQDTSLRQLGRRAEADTAR